MFANIFLYLHLSQGNVTVWKGNKEVRKLYKGDSFGE